VTTSCGTRGSLVGRINFDRQRGDRSRWTEDLFWLGQGLRWLLGQAESTPELLDDVRLKNFWHATVWGARAWIGQSLVRQDWDGAADLGLRVVALVRQLHERLAPWSVQDAMRASVAGLHDRTAFAILRRATGSAAATQVTRTAVRQALAVVEEGRAAFLSEVGQIASDEDLVAELAAVGRADAADALARLLGDAADLERRSRDEHGLGAEFTGLHRMTGDAAQPMLADAVLANRRARAAARAEALAALAAARPGQELDVASAVRTAEATSSSWSLEATWWEVANVVAAVDRPVAYLVSLTVDDDLTVDLPAFVLLVLPPSGSRRASATAVGAIHRWLPAANFEGMVKAAAAWTDPESPDAGLVEDMTRWLGQAVVTPTLSAAGNPGRLVILASGMASYLPLHAARGADGRYLVETVVLESAPSARILAATRSRAGRLATAAGGAPPRRLLTVADPAGDSGGDPLPMAEPEADAVRRLLNGHGPSLAGSTATAERLRIALSALTDSTVPAVVHLACHAFANPLHPLDSALVLAPVTREDTGVLTLSELLDVPWSQIRLVTLSACESAVPGQESPNEALSIAGALLAAGAAAVIATQRRVPDWTAAIVATRIYEEWRRTPTDLATALTNAQRWVVQAPPEEITAWCQVRIGKSIGAIGPIRAELLRRPTSWAPFMFYGS